MMIRDLTTAGALPSLEATMRFAGNRQRLIAHNIANIDTPNFVAKDIKPAHFQELLGKAIDRRREENGGAFGGLEFRGSSQIRPGESQGSLEFTPTDPQGGMLRHDRNAKDLERLMQDLVENAGVYRVATELTRKNLGTIQAAIAQRV